MGNRSGGGWLCCEVMGDQWPSLSDEDWLDSLSGLSSCTPAECSSLDGGSENCEMAAEQ